MTHIEGMRTPNLPPTRENIAASSGEWLALVAFDCMQCDGGLYVPSDNPVCSMCGATAPTDVATLIRETAARSAA